MNDTEYIEKIEKKVEKTQEHPKKEKLFERWDKLGICKGLKGNPDDDEDITRLYEYR